jgi:hypothetical protein
MSTARVTVHYGTERDEIIGRNDDGAWDAIRSGKRVRYEPLGETLRLFLKRVRKPRKKTFRRPAPR